MLVRAECGCATTVAGRAIEILRPACARSTSLVCSPPTQRKPNWLANARKRVGTYQYPTSAKKSKFIEPQDHTQMLARNGRAAEGLG